MKYLDPLGEIQNPILDPRGMEENPDLVTQEPHLEVAGSCLKPPEVHSGKLVIAWNLRGRPFEGDYRPFEGDSSL